MSPDDLPPQEQPRPTKYKGYAAVLFMVMVVLVSVYAMFWMKPAPEIAQEPPRLEPPTRLR